MSRQADISIDQMYLEIINSLSRQLVQLQANEQVLVLAVNKLTLRIQALEKLTAGIGDKASSTQSSDSQS